MPEEGYAVVTIRKVTVRADADPALVFYYGIIGELFWAIFRRGCGGGPATSGRAPAGACCGN
jgi:hypothetical protein